MIEPTTSSVTKTGMDSATLKAQTGRSGKRPSMDNLRKFSLTKQDKTSNTPKASNGILNEPRQRSTSTPAQSKGHRSGQGRQSSHSVMTGTLTEKQRQEWYKDDNLKVRLRLNGLVGGSGLGQMRAGYTQHQVQRLVSQARVATR